MQNKDRVRGILHFAFSTSYENTWWLMHAAECARTASHYHATKNHGMLHSQKNGFFNQT
jgi:hypothetical protein